MGRSSSRCVVTRPARNNYLNGTISTSGKFSYTYGYAAARIKFAKGRGQHGGFWMQPQVQASRYGSPARTGAEIDIAEFFGKGYSNGGLAHFLYTYPRKGKTTKYGDVFRRASTALAGKSDSWWSRYHVFSVEWTPTGYVFRIDGTEHLAQQQGPLPAARVRHPQPVHLRLGAEVPGPQDPADLDEGRLGPGLAAMTLLGDSSV